MLITGKVYLLTTSLYFIIVLSLVYSSLKKSIFQIFSNFRNSETLAENYQKESAHYIESTQIQMQRFSYKRTDLKIEIPDTDVASNNQGDLMLYYLKQNCFPLLLAYQDTPHLKIQQTSIWFLNLCSEIVTCAVISTMPGFLNGKADFFILGPIASCFVGLCFTSFFCLICVAFGSGRYFFLTELGKYLVLAGFWAGGFYASLIFEVRNRQVLDEKDFLLIVFITFAVDSSLAELLRTSVKLILVVTTKHKRINI